MKKCYTQKKLCLLNLKTDFLQIIVYIFFFKFGLVVDILADVVKNPKLDEQQIEEERKVILRRLNEAESDLKLVTMDYLHLTAYQGTPLGQPVLGPTKNVK